MDECHRRLGIAEGYAESRALKLVAEAERLRVIGRDMYGTYPDLALGSADDVGGGRMIPTTSADQYAATLARWFGVEDLDIPMVAPNIGNFAVDDLGFFI